MKIEGTKKMLRRGHTLKLVHYHIFNLHLMRIDFNLVKCHSVSFINNQSIHLKQGMCSPSSLPYSLLFEYRTHHFCSLTHNSIHTCHKVFLRPLAKLLLFSCFKNVFYIILNFDCY